MSTIAEQFIMSIAGRKGIKMRSLFYLTDDSRFGDYAQQAEITRHLSCHPRSVNNALTPLVEDPYFSEFFEKRKIGTAVLYKIKDNESGRHIKRALDVIRNHDFDNYSPVDCIMKFVNVLENPKS
jgi:hypothetical protein